MDLRRMPARTGKEPAMTDTPTTADLSGLDLAQLRALRRTLHRRLAASASGSPERRAALAGLSAVERAIAAAMARPPPGPAP